MRKPFLLMAVVWAIGFGMGNAFWYLASPMWTDRVVSEQIVSADRFSELKAGQFKDANSSHRGKGTATINQSGNGELIVSLTDFEVTNGPDLKVYAVENSEIKNADSVLQSRYVSLGVLKGNIGNQNYRLPADVGFEVGSIVIWCEQFSVLFSAATMKSI
ncbi:DM13 domain-containing protein [Pseudomonadota bacterium]